MKKKRTNIENKKYSISTMYRAKYKALKNCWYVFEYCVISETEMSLDRNIKSNMIYNQVHHIGRISK